MSFGYEIQMFLNQIFAEDSAIFKFMEDNSINMVFSNNKLHCNKEEFVKAYNYFTGKELCWGSILRNFGHYRMSASHDGSRDGFIIIIFPDSFSLDESFNRHWKKFPCEFPGCEFIGTRSNLRNHMRNHTSQQPFLCKRSYPCEVSGCGYSTTINSRLIVHMRTHTEERPYPCEVPGCDYVGRMHRNLKNHMRSHKKTGKEFSCEVPGCGRVFRIRMTLLNHMHFKHNEDIEKPLNYIEKPLEDIEKPLEDIEKPIELSILHNPEIAKILEAKLPVPDDGIIDVDDQTTVIDVDDDATVIDDDATVIDDDITLLIS
jgi:hypothetical protein